MNQQINPQDIKELTEIAKELGASSFILRGAQTAGLVFTFAQEPNQRINLELAEPHLLVILMKFPAGDGKEEGLETA